MSTAPTLEDNLRSYYRDLADELRLKPMGFEHLRDTTRPVVTRLNSASPRRPAMFAAAAMALVAIGVGFILMRSRAVEPSDGTATTIATTTPTFQPTISTIRPLELSSAPAGLQLVGQGVRPAGGEVIRAAVIVKQDAQGDIIERVIVRVGHISLYAGGDQQLVVPPNLATATSGSVGIDQEGRTIHLGYGLGALGNLTLEAYHSDEATNEALSDEMQQIASVLDVEAGHDISVISPLPNGWTLATVGSEPQDYVPSFYQAFEVDSPDGGARIIIDNRMLDDPDYPYWEMSQTLQPEEIRGHSGFVTTREYFASTDPSAPTPNTNIRWVILIWEEAPGHWVTMWVANTTTNEAIALAQSLVAVEEAEWSADSSGPKPSVSPFEESLIGDGDASAGDVDAALQAVVTCLDSKGFPGASYELDLPWGYSMDVQGSGANAALTACEAQYLDAVYALFIDQNGPTDEEIASADALAVECLRDAGRDIPFDSDFAEASSLVEIELAQRCLVQARDEIRASN